MVSFTALVAARAGSEMVVGWTVLASATSYTVYQDPAKNGAFPVVTGSATSGTPGIRVPLPPEKLLFFRAAGRNACGEGSR